MNIPKSEDLLLIYLPLAYLGILLEFALSKYRKENNYTLIGFFQNFNITVGQMVLHAFIVMLYAGIYEALKSYAFLQTQTTLLNLILLYIGIDFIHYWFHRWSHEVNFLWGIHLVHHAANDYNLTTSGRTPWLKSLFIFPTYLGFALLGVEFNFLLFVVLLSHLSQFWVHTNFIRHRRWLDYLLVNPSFHRAHHGTAPKYINKNYAEVIGIWDHLFGTYQPEEERPGYGLTQTININRPLYHNFFYFFYLHTLTKKACWKKRIQIHFMPPGWLPQGITRDEAQQLWLEYTGSPVVQTNVGPREKKLAWILFAFNYALTGFFFLSLEHKNMSLLAGLTLALLSLMELQGFVLDSGLTKKEPEISLARLS